MILISIILIGVAIFKPGISNLIFFGLIAYNGWRLHTAIKGRKKDQLELLRSSLVNGGVIVALLLIWLL